MTLRCDRQDGRESRQAGSIVDTVHPTDCGEQRWAAIMPGFNFEEETFLSEHRLRKELQLESTVSITDIDCCRAGCVAFTGHLARDERCYKCGQSRWKPVINRQK